VTARGNTIVRSGSTSLRLYGVEHAIIDGNIIRESKGSHANGITIYLGSRDILVANNRIEDSGSPITFQDSGNLWFINNLVDAYPHDSNVNEWGDTSHGPWERGTIAFLNNTLARNSRKASLNFGGASGKNNYISMNNIIDGGGSHASTHRSHNLYTGLSWSQAGSYGWSLAEGEFFDDDLSAIFTDASAGDFILPPGSPAINAGRDITSYLPSDVFPEFDFTLDIAGKKRTTWDIGAHAY
jgi:hypothetical protein